MAVLFFRSRLRPSDPVPLSNHIELRPVQPRAFLRVLPSPRTLPVACISSGSAAVPARLWRSSGEPSRARAPVSSFPFTFYLSHVSLSL